MPKQQDRGSSDQDWCDIRGGVGGGVGCLAGFKALPCASASVPFGLAQEQDV